MRRRWSPMLRLQASTCRMTNVCSRNRARRHHLEDQRTKKLSLLIITDVHCSRESFVWKMTPLRVNPSFGAQLRSISIISVIVPNLNQGLGSAAPHIRFRSTSIHCVNCAVKYFSQRRNSYIYLCESFLSHQ